MYVHFEEVSIQVLCLFFNWVGLFGFFGVEFVSSLSILDINPLSDVLVNMFSHSVGCLCILQTMEMDMKTSPSNTGRTMLSDSLGFLLGYS